MSKIITDEKLIDAVLTRGVEAVYPSKEAFKKKMMQGKQLKIYLGIDPTGPTLHIGHATLLMVLKDLQKFGHKIIMLIGDFTAMIGDPSGKSKTRVPLTHEQVLENCKLYKEQASHYLSFDGDNAAELKFNSKWLSKLNFKDILKISTEFTVQRLLERDMFAERKKAEQPIYLSEFMYPLMQGYDSVAMGVDVEIGGNDQIFNMLCGRTMMKNRKKEKFVLAGKLLVDPTGKKMGKSEGNMVSFLDSAEEMFGKVMSWTDGMIVPGFEIMSRVPMNEVKKMQEDMKSDKVNPKDLKVRLAKEIISGYFSVDDAEKAAQVFENQFAKGEFPEDILEFKVEGSNLKVLDLLVNSKLCSSKNDAKRMVEQGAVAFYFPSSQMKQDKISDWDSDVKIEDGMVVRVGKRRFVRIVF